MIFDLIFILLALAAMYTGFKNGLVMTILRIVFFILGGIVATYLVIEKNQSGWLILAIRKYTAAVAPAIKKRPRRIVTTKPFL